MVTVGISVFIEDETVEAGRGKSKAISRSKSRNSIATRKNRKENGNRADFRGSNPHSYGEVFSLSALRAGRICAAAVSMPDIRIVTNIRKKREVIIYIWIGEVADRNVRGLKPFDRGLIPLFSLRPPSVDAYVQE